jgi:hypothetical protein
MVRKLNTLAKYDKAILMPEIPMVAKFFDAHGALPAEGRERSMAKIKTKEKV